MKIKFKTLHEFITNIQQNSLSQFQLDLSDEGLEEIYNHFEEEILNFLDKNIFLKKVLLKNAIQLILQDYKK